MRGSAAEFHQRSSLIAACSILVLTAIFGCEDRDSLTSKAIRADRSTTRASGFPTALKPELVGEYPSQVKSGGGYFFDEVLEYRVWMCPSKGAKPLAGQDDYFFAFAEYERAAAFSQKTKGAEEPMVLIRQLQWIDEPAPGKYQVKQGERITEWRVAWLKGSKRGPHSVSEFLAKPRRPRG